MVDSSKVAYRPSLKAIEPFLDAFDCCSLGLLLLELVPKDLQNLRIDGRRLGTTTCLSHESQNIGACGAKDDIKSWLKPGTQS